MRRTRSRPACLRRLAPVVGGAGNSRVALANRDAPTPGARFRRCQAKDNGEGVIQGAELAGVEVPGGSAQALRIHDRGFRDEDARLQPFETDGRAKACRPCAGGGWRDQRGAEVEEFIGLRDDCEPPAALLMPSRTAR